MRLFTIKTQTALSTDVYFDGLGTFDTAYIDNQFIQGLKDRGYNSGNLPQGWPTQLNLNSLIGKLKNQCS